MLNNRALHATNCNVDARAKIVPALLSKRSRGGQVSSAIKLTSSHITDYFTPRLSVIMEDVRKEMEWEDEEFFATATTPMRHLRSEGVPKRRSEAEGLTADVSSNGKLVDWWGSLYEEQDDFDELVEEYLKPREAPDSGKNEEDDILLREDDFGMNKDDCEDDLLEETTSDDQGTCEMGLKDPIDASQMEDLVLHPPGNVVEDRSSQDEPDLSGAVPTPRDDILFLPTGGLLSQQTRLTLLYRVVNLWRSRSILAQG